MLSLNRTLARDKGKVPEGITALITLIIVAMTGSGSHDVSFGKHLSSTKGIDIAG
jgi:hypothetical protein